MTGKNVMKVGYRGDSIYYKIGCDCMSSDCDLLLELETEDKMMFLTMYQKLTWTSDFFHGNWFKDIWTRIKVVSRLLFLGHVEVTGGLVIKGEEHIDGFIEALKEGKKEIKKN